MEYVIALLAFAATCVAIRGNTWRADRRGLARLTGTGRAALLLALGTLAVSAFQAHTAHRNRIDRRNVALHWIAAIGHDTYMAVMAAKFDEDVAALFGGPASHDWEDELPGRLREDGTQFSDIVNTFGNVLTVQELAILQELSTNLTSRADMVTTGVVCEYLTWLDATLGRLRAAIRTDGSKEQFFTQTYPALTECIPQRYRVTTP